MRAHMTLLLAFFSNKDTPTFSSPSFFPNVQEQARASYSSGRPSCLSVSNCFLSLSSQNHFLATRPTAYSSSTVLPAVPYQIFFHRRYNGLEYARDTKPLKNCQEPKSSFTHQTKNCTLQQRHASDLRFRAQLCAFLRDGQCEPPEGINVLKIIYRTDMPSPVSNA